MATNKYFTHVKPRFKEIEKWISEGATQANIAKCLGISERSLRDYLRKYSDFAELYKIGKIELVKDLRSVLVKKAKGFQYTETEKILEHGIVVKEVEKIKTALPDVAALNLLLKNYDKANWANDPQMLDLKKKELKLKEKQADDNW